MAALQLAAFPVREVPGGMTDAERVVGRRIACSETRSAECGLQHSSRFHDLCCSTVFDQFHINRHAGRVNTQGKFAAADIGPVQDIRCCHDIFKAAACTSRDDTLLYIQFPIYDLIGQGIWDSVIQAHCRAFFHFRQNVAQICVYFFDRIHVARMERHCDHRLDLAKVDLDRTIVIRAVFRFQFFVSVCSSVNLIEILHFLVSLPDGGKAGGLRRHDIDPDPEISGKLCDARSGKLQDFVFHIAILENGPDQCQCHILRADTFFRFSGQIDADDLRHIDIISLIQELFHQFRSALADCHAAERAIAGMGIAAQDHGACFCQHFPCELMDHGLVRRNIDAAVFLCAGQAEDMVIFIDGASDSTKGVVAVGQYVWHREFFQSGSPCRLDDPHISDVVGSQFVKTDLELIHGRSRIVCCQDLIRDRFLVLVFVFFSCREEFSFL